MASAAETGNEGVTNGTTAVTIVPAPSSGNRNLVRAVTVYNADTVNATVTLRKKVSTTTYVKAQKTLMPNEVLEFEIPVVLDATTKTIEIVLAANVATNQLQWDVAYLVIVP